MLLLALAAAGTLGTSPPARDLQCRDLTTVATEQCLVRRRDAAMRTLDRYRSAARARIVRESPEVGALPIAFDAAQAAWVRYARQQCGTVEMWQGGTVRNATALACDIRMTELRTHELWHDWLTFVDRTPPILPEPPVTTGG